MLYNGIYDGQIPLIPTEAIIDVSAFARIHVIEGENIMCVLASDRQKRFANALTEETLLSVTHKVLYVSQGDMSGMRILESLKVDGQLYRITGIQEYGDIVRIELEGVSG